MKPVKNIRELPMLQDYIHKATDLEAAIIGACLIDYSAVPKIMTILKPEMFYDQFHSDTWEVIAKLFEDGRSIDYITVTTTIRQMTGPKYEGVNLYYNLAILTRDVVAVHNVSEWAFMLVEVYQNRETLLIQNGYYVGDTPQETRQIIGERLLNLTITKTSDWLTSSQVATALLEHLDKVEKSGKPGVRLGLQFFDAVTHGGGKGSQLIVIGARPGVGKSAIINKWATMAANQGTTVGIINLEMRDINSFARMVSIESGIPYSDIMEMHTKAEMEQKELMAKISHMAGKPIYYAGASDLNITDIRAKAIQLHRQRNLGILFIDYLQLIEPAKSNDNREQQVAKMSRGCKQLSRFLDIPVVLLAQLNRESTKAGDKRPQLTQLRESGAIEQDADIVMLLHRDIDEEGLSEAGTENEAWAKIAKHREGKTTPWIKIGFNGEQMKFYDYSPVPVLNAADEPPKLNRPSFSAPNLKPINNNDLPF